MANANNGGAVGTVTNIQDWTSQSTYWTLLAGSVFLGLILLHWWRPLDSTLPPVVDTAIHLLPAVAGGWILIQVGSDLGSDPTARLLVTLVCLVGLLAGVTMAWSHIKNPRRLPSYLALSYVNMIVLTAIWVGAEAAAAEMQILLLALGGLFLFSPWAVWSGRWERVISFIFLMALAGFPLTIGFPGRIGLYRSWLEGGQLILAVLVAFLIAAILGAALQIVRHRGPEKNGAVQRRFGYAEYGAVLAVLAIGVIGFNDLDQLLDNIVPFAFILLSAVGGYLLSRYSIRTYEMEQKAARALHINLPLRQAADYFTAVLLNIQSIVRQSAAILEGEGGMVWLLIIVVILWLARIS